VYAEDEGITKSFRNIPGVQLCNVERMNLLTLAPGGTFGRFVVYTEGAMKKMNHIFGTYKGPGTQKKGYRLPRTLLENADIARLVNSDEVQAVVRPALEGPAKYNVKKNGLVNKGVLARLRPGINAVKKNIKLKEKKGTKQQAEVQAAKKKRKVAAKKRKAQSKKFYNNMMDAYKPKVVEEEAEEE